MSPAPIVRVYTLAAILSPGIDVAGSDGGDETVVAVQAAGNILALGAWSLKDPLTKVNEFLLPYKARIEEVNVDVIGVGHNFVPRLEALGYPCNEVNVGAATQFPDQFANLKAQLYCKLRDDRAEAIMLAFADRTPGIFAYVKQKAQHQQAVETAIRQGKPPPPEPDDADELADAYNQVMPELEGGGSTCPKCGGALGVTTTTINTDGRSYHPECARGW